MLTRLKFKVEFASTQKLFQGTHEFQTGMTAIIGKNEAGKSLRLEMIRYALFGSKALRSDAKSYKRLEVKLIFSVHVGTPMEAAYEVHRIGNKHRLMKADGTELAVGVSPVNAAIVKLMGYDLEVFDVANAVMQDEIASLSRKTPTERKRMVDRTIGLDAVDRVTKGVNEEILTVKKTVDLLKTMVIETHAEPVCPDDVKNLSLKDLEAEAADLQAKAQERKHIEGRLLGAKCDQPGAPVWDNPVTETTEELVAKQGEITTAYNKLADIRRQKELYEIASAVVKGGPTAGVIQRYIDEDFDTQWKNFEIYESKRVEMPTVTHDDLKLLEQALHTAKARDVVCPSCAHGFKLLPDGETTNPVEVPEGLLVHFGTITSTKLLQAERELRAYEAFAALPVVEQPILNKITHAFRYRAAYEQLVTLEKEGFNPLTAEAQLTEGQAVYDRDLKTNNDKIAQRRLQDSANQVYDHKMANYVAYLALLEELKPQFEALEYVHDRIGIVNEQYAKRRRYEEDLGMYQAKQAAQQNALDNLAFLEKELETLQNVKKALTELKPKVKVHLLPSLNKVASSLLAQMTNAERNSIEIDEEFDIKVDGQAMNELSGSAKAVANLAVRIGLGMVLTNRVFSVLLADEIDAAMDDERASYTAGCIRNLFPTIKQIMLISHKQPEADNLIEL